MSFFCVDPVELLARYEPVSDNIQSVLPESIGPDNRDFPNVLVRTDSNSEQSIAPDLSFNPFSGLGLSIFDHPESLELASIQFVYNIMENEGVYLALNAGPGAWIQYMQYLSPSSYGFGVTSRQHDWSLKSLDINMKDFILHYGDDNTGDLTKSQNRQSSSNWIMNYISSTNENGFLGEGVDLVIANGDMLLPELWTGINCLRKNGNLVIRLTNPDDVVTMQACYLTSQIFERSTLFKPISSHPAKPECFLICHHRQSANNDEYLTLLAGILEISPAPSNIIETVSDKFAQWYGQMLNLINLNQQRYLTESLPLYDFARIHTLWNLPLVDRTYAPWHFQLKQRNYPETILYEDDTNQKPTSSSSVLSFVQRDRVLEDKIRKIFQQYQGRNIPISELRGDGTNNIDKIVASLLIVMTEQKYPYPRLSTFLTPEPGTVPNWIRDYFTEKDDLTWYRYGNMVRKVVTATLTDPVITKFDYETLRQHLDLSKHVSTNELIQTWTELGATRIFDVFVQDGSGLTVAAKMGLEYLGYDPNTSNQLGYNKLIDFLQPVLKRPVGITATIPENGKFDLLYIAPTKPDNVNEKDWLLGQIFPAIHKAWSNLVEGGKVYVQAGPYAHPISYYIDIDLAWQKGSPPDHERRANAFEYFRQHYGLKTLPNPSKSVLDFIDDFPYYHRMEGFPTAQRMFENLQKTVPPLTRPARKIEKYVKLTQKLLHKRKPDLPPFDPTPLFDINLSPLQRLNQLRPHYISEVYKPPNEQKRAESRAELVKSRIRDVNFKPNSLLDVGAGSGSISVAVAKLYNISPQLTFIIEPHGQASSQYKLLNYTNEGLFPAELEDESIDLILLFQVLHHIPLAERSKLISEISRVLSPGGIIVMREHDTDYNIDFETYIGLIHDMDELDSGIPQGQTHLMSRSELKLYMSQSGLFADHNRYHSYEDSNNPQRIYHDIYVKPSARASIPFDSFVRSDTNLIVRKWPESYLATDFISNHFTEKQRMMCNISGKPSPIQYWNSLSFSDREGLLRKGIQFANDKIYDYICTNFNPTFCLDIILYLVGYRAKILDPSAGWGDRMIAALASQVTYYTATDPNTMLQPAYQQIVETLGPLAGHMSIDNIRKTYKVFPKYFEEATIREGFYDIALTSPPYYTYEEYHNARLDLSYLDWLHQVYRPYLANMVKGVKITGYIVIYVGDISIDHTPYKLATDTILIMDEYVQQGRLRVMAPFGFRADTVSPRGQPRPGKVRTALVWYKLG